MNGRSTAVLFAAGAGAVGALGGALLAITDAGAAAFALTAIAMAVLVGGSLVFGELHSQRRR